MPATIATGAARISGQGVATTRTASARSASPEASQASTGDRQGHGQERQGPAVGEPHERRLLRLRRLDQADDAGVGAVGRGRVRAKSERRRRR